MKQIIALSLIFISTASAQAADATTIVPPPAASPLRQGDPDWIARAYGQPALSYLESLAGKRNYLAPSQLDPRFTTALYVNAAARGSRAQRMFVLHRSNVGEPWRLGMWDRTYWSRKRLPKSVPPPYSWKVSTGRHYLGDQRSGPTPLGVFGLDERKGRVRSGYHAPGMIHVAFFDLHYRSGRRSGVAFHGTTRGRYSRLGRIDSHGCIRMTQTNALALIKRLQGRDGVLSSDVRWGPVPRYWTRERYGVRRGYRRNGRSFAIGSARQPKRLATLKARNVTTDVLTDNVVASRPRVLTKTGYRAVVVVFKD
ncbi:MAG: L,D-transpeptidase [Pseudomonadota bacterium]